MVYETRYPAGCSMRWHVHERPYLTFILEGGFTEICKPRSLVASKGALVLRPKCYGHAVNFNSGDSPTRVFRIETTDTIADEGEVFSGEEPCVLNNCSVASLAVRLRRQCFSVQTGGSLEAESLLLSLLTSLTRAASPFAAFRGAAWVSRTEELLRQRYREPISLQEIAVEVGVHPVSLSRGFKAQLGVTMTQYVRSLRIDEACRMLCTSNKNIADIAIEMGFCDQSHFHRHFSRVTGLTPLSFRRGFN